MMGNFKDICLELAANLGQEGLFRLCFYVSGKEKAELAVLEPQHQRLVVDIVIYRLVINGLIAQMAVARLCQPLPKGQIQIKAQGQTLALARGFEHTALELIRRNNSK